MNKELLIVRHARSQHNCGQTDCLDSPLTEFGELQAETVGRYLSSSKSHQNLPLQEFEYFVSPFLRCLQTMKAIYNEANIKPKVTVLPILGEYLAFDTVSVPRRQEEFPEYDWSEFPFDSFLQEADYIDSFARRMHRVYESMGPRSVVVTHGMVVMTLAHIAMGNNDTIPLWDHSINNCSLTWIQSGRKRWWGRVLHHEINYQDHPKFH